MKKNERCIIFVANVILCAIMIVGMLFLLQELEQYIRTAIFLLIILLSSLCTFFVLLNREKLSRIAIACNIFMFFLLSSFFILNISGVFEKISDISNIKKIIIESGSWGVIICLSLTIFNVVILPAPSFALYLAIASIYGSFWGFVLCYTGTVVGSIIAFYIARAFGKKVVYWCVGEENTERYSDIITKRGKMPFVMMQILPFFPDDILCMVAGLSSMSYKFFINCMLLIRPIYIAFVCFMGTGDIIPFSGWGIPLWILIATVTILFTAVYYKRQEKIDAWFSRLFAKDKKTKKLRIKNNMNKDMPTGDLLRYVNEKMKNGYGDEAIRELERLSGLNNPSAQFFLAKFYQLGSIVDRDVDRAISLYASAANAGHVMAKLCLAMIYAEREEKHEIAFKLLGEVADNGIASAQFMLGEFYEYGKGTEKDIDTAILWYERAAKQHYISAEAKFGDLYLNGIGFEKDEKKAYEIYLKAAKRDFAPAFISLGDCYQHGKGTKKSLENAARMYTIALERGVLAAQERLVNLDRANV